MNGNALFEGMGYVSEGFVDEAEYACLPQISSKRWKPWISVAACLCLVIAGMFWIWNPRAPATSDSNTSAGQELEVQDDTAAATAPAGGVLQDQPAAGAEVPSLILRVEARGDLGFTGRVEQLTDTDIFPVGTVLTVILADQAAEVTRGEGSASREEIQLPQQVTDGALVLVQFTSYDKSSNTITVDLVEVLDEKGGSS